MAEFTKIGYGQVEPNKLTAQKTGQIYASLPLDKEVDVLQNGEFMFYNKAKGYVTSNPTIKGEGESAVKMAIAHMVFNEIKIYEDWLSYKDFAMIRVGDNYVTNRPAIGTLTSQNAYMKAVTNSGGQILKYENDVRDPYQDGSRTVGVDASPAHTEYGYQMEGIAPRLLAINIDDIWTTNMIEGEIPDKTPTTDAKGTILGLKKSDRNTLVLSPDGDVTDMKFAIVKDYTMPDGQRGFQIQRIA